MNGDRHSPIVPARVTVSQLAEAIQRSVDEVRSALGRADEPARPDDTISGQEAQRVARLLGTSVTIEARDTVLEMLYQWDISGAAPDLTSSSPRARHLFEGVVDHCEELDRLIETASEHWSVARMPVLDRSILRIGLFELLYDPGTPGPVAVSEAVRLAKTYSTEKSGSFVNGVLGSLARGRDVGDR
ncbi:MAG: transcription antitermination factor NusB [Acidimicrobiia bacterium]